MDTLLIELRKRKALALLQYLKALDIIRLLSTETSEKPAQLLSERFRGSITASEADEFNQYVEQSRTEWERDF